MMSEAPVENGDADMKDQDESIEAPSATGEELTTTPASVPVRGKGTFFLSNERTTADGSSSEAEYTGDHDIMQLDSMATATAGAVRKSSSSSHSSSSSAANDDHDPKDGVSSKSSGLGKKKLIKSQDGGVDEDYAQEEEEEEDAESSSSSSSSSSDDVSEDEAAPPKRKNAAPRAAKKQSVELDLEALGLLRRSGRARKEIVRFTEKDEEEDDDEDGPPRRKPRGRAAAGGNTRQRNNRSKMEDNSEEEEEESEDDDDWGGRKRTTRKPKQKKKTSSGFGDFYAVRSSSRTQDKRVKYFDEEDEQDEEEEKRQKKAKKQAQTGIIETDEIAIDKVLGHRDTTVEPAEGEGEEEEDGEAARPKVVREYFVKWQGKSNLHNSWETQQALQYTKGYKRLENYIKKLQERMARRQWMTADEIEQEDISAELQRQIEADSTIVDRVLAQRDFVPTDDRPDPATEYLVKWKCQQYSDCTWEHQEDIAAFQKEIDQFLEREQNQLTGKVTIPSADKRGPFKPFDKTPEFLVGGELRDYQLQGVNWLSHSWCQDRSVLLADEMGLGKTIQTISFLSYLQFVQNLPGPFLVVVPQSTIESWMNEFKKWSPQMNVVMYHGSAHSRSVIRQFEWYNAGRGARRYKFNALVTTPQIILEDEDELKGIKWVMMAVDEAHQLKNRESKRFLALKEFHCANRLLLTGTPLHNNLQELWTLLHFLNPDQFEDLEEFLSRYGEIEDKTVTGQHKTDLLGKMLEELQPFILRRVKKDVEKSLPNKTERILRVDLAPRQKQIYKLILSKNFEELHKASKSGARSTLLNICMELKKVCNHPILFDQNQSDIGRGPQALNSLIQAAGKMCLLDKLLVRLREKGHRVLIFSQMVKMLDILADYLTARGFKHQRLDGTMRGDLRQKAMDHFNAEGSSDFCFLLSTKAGGLGINLATADTVIIYDSDWNPQNDLQAEARAHRIGQTKQVNIYRFVTSHSIEEKILERAKEKMVLDHIVIQQMNKKDVQDVKVHEKKQKEGFSKDELAKILRFGAEDLFKGGAEGGDNKEEENMLETVDLDKILEQAEETTEALSAADEFLNSFKVANLSFKHEDLFTHPEEKEEDISFWNRVIPEQEKQKFANKHMILAPRSRTVTSYAENKLLKKDGENALSDDDDDVKGKKKTKKKSTGNNGSSNNSNGANGPIDAKEFRRLHQALLKFGDSEDRFTELLLDSKLTAKSQDQVQKAIQDLIEQCSEAVKHPPAPTPVEKDDENENENGNGQAGTVTTVKQPSYASVQIGGVKVNASELIERLSDLKALESSMRFCKEDPYNKFRLATSIKPPLKWPVKWTFKDDAMLLVGVYLHGFGNWTQIADDPNLDLGMKVPALKNEQLKARAVRLLKTVRQEVEGKSVVSKGKSRLSKDKDKEDEKVPHKKKKKETTEDKKSKTKMASSKSEKTKKKKRKEEEQEDEEEQPKDHSGSGSGSGSDSDDGMNRKFLKTCKKLLKPAKTILKKLRSLQNEQDAKLKVKKTKRYLVEVGQIVTDVLDENRKKYDKQLLDTHLWHVVSTYTASTGPMLKKLFHKLNDENKGEKETHNNISNSSGKRKHVAAEEGNKPEKKKIKSEKETSRNGSDKGNKTVKKEDPKDSRKSKQDGDKPSEKKRKSEASSQDKIPKKKKENDNDKSTDAS